MTATNSPSSAPPMPYELLRETFGYLASDPRSLCALSISSRSFAQEAQQILFEDVDTTDWQYKKLLKFSRTITASPERLALYVRKYKLDYFEVPGEPGICTEFLSAMRQSLEAIRNLKWLEIQIMDTLGPSTHGIAQELLRGCTFSLETLEWTHDSDDRDTEELFENFLPKQRNLKHIGINSCWSLYTYLERRQPILSSICPELTSLRAPWVLIKVMLPGHKITEIAIVNSYEDKPPNDAEVISVVPELERIQYFSCSFSCLPEGMVRILQHCSSVEVIELVHFLEGIHDNLLHILPKFPALDMLVLYLDLGILGSIRPPEEQKVFVRSIFEKCGDNLEVITILIEDDEIYYTRSDDDTSGSEDSEGEF